MAGQLDSLLKSVAKQIVSDLGTSLDSTIIYTKKGVSSYNVDTGENITLDTTYSDLKVPVEFVQSTEDDGRERREAKIYISPDLIGDNQPSFEDEITLTYAGSTRVGQIVNIDTRQGGQTYLFTILVRF
nr:CheA signal transduction histidine kinase [uncultured Mediterranean phage uvMED]